MDQRKLTLLYKRGNLQDAINANVVNGTHFPEQEMVRLFKGTCEAVRAMHHYRAPMGPQQSSSGSGQPSTRRQPPEDSGRHSDDDERFPQAEGDGEDGYSYQSSSIPLVSRHQAAEDADVIFEDHEDASQVEQGNGDPSKTEHVPYAHRDLKPGYAYSICSPSSAFLHILLPQKCDDRRRRCPDPDGFRECSES